MVLAIKTNNTTLTYKHMSTCLQGFANNKGADQCAHLHSLISTFVIRLLESIISKFDTSEISLFELFSVAEQTGLNLTLGNPEDRYSRIAGHSHVSQTQFLVWINLS